MISIDKNINTLIFTGGENLETLLNSTLFCTISKSINHFCGTLPTENKDNHCLEFIICADSGLEKCIRYGKHPNIILGDMDSLSDKAFLNNYDSSIILKYPKDKDFTDTELALNYAFEKYNNGFVTLIGGDGGRMDHLFAILQIYKTNTCPDFWFCKEGAWIYFSNDRISSLTVSQLNKNDSISIFSLPPIEKNNEFYNISSTGLNWELDSVKWEKNEYSVSNRIKDDEDKISLKCKNGRFIVFLPYSCKVEGLC